MTICLASGAVGLWTASRRYYLGFQRAKFDRGKLL